MLYRKGRLYRYMRRKPKTKPSPAMIDAVAIVLANHMHLSTEPTPVLFERARWWLRRVYTNDFKRDGGGYDDVAWLLATVSRIQRKPRHYSLLERGKVNQGGTRDEA
jgi:hypothetical protein